MSKSNTCTADQNPKRFKPLDNSVNDQFSFFLLKVLNSDVRSDDTIKSVIVLVSDAKNSAVNKYPANVLT